MDIKISSPSDEIDEGAIITRKQEEQTMLEAAKAMILYSAIEKVDKKTVRVNSKLTKPKTGKKKQKVPVAKVKFERGHKIMKPNTIGLGGAKPASRCCGGISSTARCARQCTRH